VAEQRRETCPVCHVDRQVLKAGTFREHKHEGTRCPASGHTPEQAKAMGISFGRPGEPMVEAEPDTGALVPEVVTNPQPQPEQQPGTALAVHQPAASPAIEAAAEAALAMPGAPAMAEVQSLAVTARILSLSGAAPKAIRDNPYVAFHVALVGRDLGISPSAAISLIDVIGKDGDEQLSLSPELLSAQIRRLGLGSIRPLKRTKDEAIAGAYDPEGTLIGETDFTWEDAQIAGLVDDRCQPTQHWRPNNGQGKCTCRQGWRTYPKRMLWWRAVGYCASDFFPDAGLGLYSPEELGAVVGEDGRPLDPANVDLPDGYEPHNNGGQAQPQGGEDWADGGDLWILQARIHALPEAQAEKLRGQWKQQPRLRRNGHVSPPFALTVSQYRVVRSLVQGLESEAAHAEGELGEGYDRDQTPKELRAGIERALIAAMCASLGAGPREPAAQPAPQPEVLTPDEVLTDRPVPEGPPPVADAPAPAEPAQEVRLTDADRAEIRAAVDALSVEEVQAEAEAAQIQTAGVPTLTLRAMLVGHEVRRREDGAG